MTTQLDRIEKRLLCWIRHNWSDWSVYNKPEDRWKGSYEGNKLMDYIPAIHERSCLRCGHTEKHDLRSKAREQ